MDPDSIHILPSRKFGSGPIFILSKYILIIIAKNKQKTNKNIKIYITITT